LLSRSRKVGTPVLTAILIAGCGAPPDPQRTNDLVERPGLTAHYDQKTGRLSRLELDQNKNGRKDTFSFWNGTSIERIEVDQDEDGRVDRWEHYGAGNKLTKVGTSSRDDVVEDTSATIEEIARRERGFIRPGEKLFIVRDAPRQK